MADILTINAGSSSIKFALYATDATSSRIEGAIEHIGLADPRLVLAGAQPQPVQAADHHAATKVLVEWVKQAIPAGNLAAIGHRVVHGGPKFSQAQIIDADTIDELKQLIPYDSEHLPAEIKLIEALQQLYPALPQIACFDTAFHHDLPAVSRLLPIPRKYAEAGVRRYGFHGLSYSYVLTQINEVDVAHSRIVLAHLGSGVSLAAVHNGKSVDTTMGLTPAGGVPMSTRSGDLDPSLALYLEHTAGLSSAKFNHMVNFESGLLGVSGSSADMEALLQQEASDPQAKEAVDLFCYQVKKAIGGLVAGMGGIDALVFTGGMGEQAPKVRARVSAGLEHLGIQIDSAANDSNARRISADGALPVLVIPTNEAATIASEVSCLLEAS